MRKFKLMVTVFCCTLLTMISAGCTESKQEASPYVQIINELTHKDMKGRLTGTDGNLQAQQLIEEYFRKIGLETFERDRYLHSYSHHFFDPEQQIYAIEIAYNNGERKQLEYGVEFLEHLVNYDLDVSGPITFDFADPHLEDRIVITADNPQEVYGKAKAILHSSELLKKILPKRSSDFSVFQISQPIYERLRQEEQQIESINLQVKVQAQQIEAANVVGKISGQGYEGHKDAIILSAHFDSIGWANEQVYQGAVDNATGVAALIQVASALKQYADEHPVNADILFVAYNGEESDLQGSEAFVQDIQKKYDHLYNINLDTIGIKNGGPVLIVGDDTERNKALMAALEESLLQHQMDAKVTHASLTSDHVSFNSHNLSAVTIGQEDFTKIHTPEDTTDLVDFEFLPTIVEAVYDFVSAASQATHEHMISFSGQDSHQENQQVRELTEEERIKYAKKRALEEEELKTMKFGQYKTIEYEPNQWMSITKNHEEFNNKSEAESLIPGLYIPESIEQYKFDSVRVYADFGSIEDNFTIGEVYTVDEISMKSITGISLIYKNEEGDDYQISISKNNLYHNNGSGREIEEVVYESQPYQIKVLNPNISLYTTYIINDNTYDISIVKGKKPTRILEDGSKETGFTITWTTDDKQEALEFAHSLNLPDLIKNLGFE